MPKESTQKKLSRVRKPRVHITYEVDTGGAIEAKELPFVVGVMADLSGQPKDALAKMRDRKFVEIDRDNFNQVLAGTKPRLTMRVPNTIANDDSTLGVELEFGHIDDFGPEAIAQQVTPLRKLVEARQRLNELALRVNASDRLEELLQDVVQNSETLKTMADVGREAKDEKDSPRGEGE